MENRQCPTTTHFHVVYESVNDFEKPSKIMLTKTPLEALAKFLPASCWQDIKNPSYKRTHSKGKTFKRPPKDTLRVF